MYLAVEGASSFVEVDVAVSWVRSSFAMRQCVEHIYNLLNLLREFNHILMDPILRLIVDFVIQHLQLLHPLCNDAVVISLIQCCSGFLPNLGVL